MIAIKRILSLSCFFLGQIAQSVEQRTENPCVAGSIPVLATSAGALTCSCFFLPENSRTIAGVRNFLKSPKTRVSIFLFEIVLECRFR